MKILAVIPARAGSKQIPNKNIRIIGGHPLVYYAIRNALRSNYITDVIVTTDSPEVKIVATQMGAEVKWRDASLCGDAVTLDAVIADAIPVDREYEYVITMQPTSPTLNVATLDQGIKYTIDNNFDTVISVVNAPHLSWRKENGIMLPNYHERLNRQYLPPYYIETGAFMVSKHNVITSSTRIGKKVGVYELPEEEAQDVDTFADLRNVASTIEQQKVAIYVNGNRERGMGHIYRALEIADEFYSKPDIYYDLNQTQKQAFGKTTHTLIPVNGIVDLYEKCKNNGYTIFINDILSTTIDYIIGLRTVLPKAKIINFEDDGEGIIKADLVFNALFSYSNFPHVYAGEQYYIPGKMFMYYRPIVIHDDVKRILISFGGTDPQNYSERLLHMITKSEYARYTFIVVLGRGKSNVDELMAYSKYNNIEIYYDVQNMPELMSSCDIAITSRGRTGYELALLGIPSISMAQNHREEKHSFVSEENGFTYIGLNPADEIIENTLKMYLSLSKSSRQRFQDLLLSHDLRNGRQRVMNLINRL